MLVTRPHPLGGRILLALFLLTGCFALLSRAAAFPDWTDCPAVCRCKWTSGKKSALCPDAGLTSLPASLDPDMQVLDLSGNKIPELQAEIFKRAGLVNLQRVFLRNAGIYSIHADSFKDMRILIEIDLSDNHVTSLEPDTFLGNERLRILILSGNPLGTLRNMQFPALQHLRNLELQRCSLTEIHGQAFSRLTGLEFLKLDGNHLEYLEASVISNLSRLKTLTLEGNQWKCDCRLRGFRTWLIPEAPSKLYSVPQICSGPQRLEGRKWEDVKPVEFACEPKVFVSASSIQEETNGNLSLACLATGDPEPEISWQLNGGPVNVTKSTDQSYTGTLVVYTTSEIGSASSDKSASSRIIPDRWSNITVYNASDSDAGEYVCFARNIAGVDQGAVNVAIPRVYTAPTLSQSDDWMLWVNVVGGGVAVVFLSISIVMLAWVRLSRRHSKREKIKLGSSSFGDQEKKLLDLSVTPTTPGNSNDRGSGHGSLGEACSTNDLELAERGSICDPMAAAAVTVERLRPAESAVNAIRTVPCASTPAGVFPPPPPEFTTGVLPAGIFGNIFISVSLPQDASSERCYPDLLDIPVHAVSGAATGVVTTGSKTILPATSTVNVSSFATLPRRALRTSEVAIGSPYDNMGPRITANGSSAFSLTDMDLRLSPSPPPRIIQPPHEFVSL